MSAGAFVTEALDDNREGRLTAAQRDGLRAGSRGFRKAELQFAAIATVIGLLVWFGPGPARYATTKPLVGVACLIIAGFLLVRAFAGADSLTRDLRAGRVDSVEGAITRSKQSGRSLTSFYVSVGGRRVEASRAQYDAAPDAGIVKIYFLPASRRLVNLEQLADRPLPAGAATDPRHALGEIAKAVGSHDAVRSAEGRASLAALGKAMMDGIAQTDAAKPPASRDPRPLAESILGTWGGGFASLTFRADGTVEASMPGGIKRSGSWSIDPAGHLVSDATGTQEVADAWVTGDELTISSQGRGLTFRRVQV